MKNQYFGDLNDYRKYGLLRILTRVSGLRVGVCWMLTPDDKRTDGSLRSYLANPVRWRSFDPDLYDKLQQLRRGARRSVRRARDWNLIPRATYFEVLLHDDSPSRDEYFRATWKKLRECALVFLDPDNGIEVPSTPFGKRGSAKYLYWREIEQAYGGGQSLLIYQHYPRVSRDRFVPTLSARILERTQAARVAAFCTPRVAFFLVQQPGHVELLSPCTDQISNWWSDQIRQWPLAFTQETGTGNRSGLA